MMTFTTLVTLLPASLFQNSHAAMMGPAMPLGVQLKHPSLRGRGLLDKPEGCVPYSKDACEAAALLAGLELGYGKWAFESTSKYYYKGCYTYKAPPHRLGKYYGHAFYGSDGSGGPLEDKSSELGETRVKVPGYDCAGLVDCSINDVHYPGNDINKGDDANQLRETPELCQEYCQQTSTCEHWTWNKDKHCWLKNMKMSLAGPTRKAHGAVTGPKFCGLVDCSINDVHYPGNDINKGGDANQLRETPEKCQEYCQQTSTCMHWTWNKDKHCWLKNMKMSHAGPTRKAHGAVTGPKFCAVVTTTTVRPTTTINPNCRKQKNQHAPCNNDCDCKHPFECVYTKIYAGVKSNKQCQWPKGKAPPSCPRNKAKNVKCTKDCDCEYPNQCGGMWFGLFGTKVCHC